MRDGHAVLLTDGSAESSRAHAALVERNIDFSTIPTEGPAPVLLSRTSSYTGFDSISAAISEWPARDLDRGR